MARKIASAGARSHYTLVAVPVIPRPVPLQPIAMPDITPLTTLTADPAFRLLLAQAGFEAPNVPPEAGWRVFQVFGQLPALHQDDGASFQSEVAEEEGSEPVLSLLFVRQLTDPLENGSYRTRRVALQYLYPPPAPGSGLKIGEKILWQPDYDSWAAFAADVEASDEFRYAMAARPEHAALFVEEDLPEET